MLHLVSCLWKKVEKSGGMAKAVSQGWPKLWIEESAARKQARIDSGEEVIVGVNKYRLESSSSDNTDSSSKNSEELEILKIDAQRVRDSQIERIKQLKNSRDEKKVQQCLMELELAAKDTSKNLLEASVNAARVRCTLGEICGALEKVWGRHVPRDDVVSDAYRGSYREMKRDAKQEGYDLEQVIEHVVLFEERFGRRPRILVAKMGQDGHDRGAKVIASGFAGMWR